MIVQPHQVQVGARWVKFSKLTQSELTAFIQERSLNMLMRGTAFGTVISEAIEMTMAWENSRR